MKALLTFFILGAGFCAATSLAEEKRQETKIQILVAAYANTDVTVPENRVFVVGNTVFRTVTDLKNFMAGFASYPKLGTHFYVVGNDIIPSPNLSRSEVDELESACTKAGIKFTYRPGG